MDYRDNLLSKAKWREPVPAANGSPIMWRDYTQDDFLRQYYPSSHRIFDEAVYPNIYRSIREEIYDEQGNPTGHFNVRYYVEKVPRFAFAYQQLIVTKQLCHLTGNDIQFDLNAPTESEKTKEAFQLFKDDWQEKGQNEAFYFLCKGVKITGDAAYVGYLNDGVFNWKVLSYFDGDTLYPHYDARGKLDCFARKYTRDNNGVKIECLEVWDDRFLYRLHAPLEGERTFSLSLVNNTVKVDGYTFDDFKAHGFPFIPIAYHRDPKGACWLPSQNSIDEYEVQFSQMAQNNKVFGVPTLYLQGDNIAAQHDIDGSIRILEMGPDDKAGYLSAQSASDSYMKELEELKVQIYEQSFIVKTPELKSGDLPAAALKILYSPAYEKAKIDADEYNGALQQMVSIFAYGDGIERESTTTFASLPMVAWIRPYAHLSESAIMADLAIGVQNGFVSRKTASERAWFYTTDNEQQRLAEQAKEEEKMDLLAQYEKDNAEGIELDQ